MLLIYFFAGVLLVIASFIMYVFEDTNPYVDDLRLVFRLIPNYCLGDAFFYLSLLPVQSLTSFETPNQWEYGITGYDLIYMGIEAVVYFVAVVVLDHLVLANKLSLNCKRVSPAFKDRGLDSIEDSDVVQEKERIQSGHGEDDLIRLHGLRKVYPQKVAVNDLWFSIPAGQCFGFLGVNGAGKTTTLKMITGDEMPTQGNAFISGVSAIKEPWKVRRHIGYCPQFDALHPLMTAEETLAMYARLRGFPENKIDGMIKYLCERLTLDQDNQHKRPAGTYSGGNKRKLSVAIALIGSPKCVFLDEPSTGMDPVSRRFMWNFISETMTSRAVILTTHSMEECEALCARISILVHGRLRCIGSSQHLKARYGKGFEFEISVDEKNVDQAREWIADSFSGAKEIECYGGSMKYKLDKQNMTLSQVFTLVESNKKEIGITNYSVGQTTLEQIFIHFAKEGDRELACISQGQDYVSRVSIHEPIDNEDQETKFK